jgi:hypothetical protein
VKEIGLIILRFPHGGLRSRYFFAG